MTKRKSGRRVVLAVLCSAILAVAGVGYAQQHLVSVCESYENVIRVIDIQMGDCAYYGDCAFLEVYRNDMVCMADACWNSPGGYCPATQ